MTTVQWKDDSRALELLKHEQCAWTLYIGDSEEINRSVSRRNNARHGDPIVEDHVESLVAAIADGEPVERLVGRRLPDNTIELFGGNHRDEALIQINTKERQLYLLIDPSDRITRALPKLLNRDHGLGPGKEERLHDAVQEHLEHGLSAKDAASMYRVNVYDVRDAARYRQLLKSLSEQGVTTPECLPKTTVLRLWPLQDQQVVQTSLCKLLVECERRGMPTTAVVNTLFDKIKRVPTEAEKLAEIDLYRQQNVRSTFAKARPSAEKQALINYVSKLRRLTDGKSTVKQLQMEELQEVKPFYVDLQGLMANLLRFRDSCEAIIKSHNH